MGRDFFRGRRALITGGSGGIGAAIADRLVRRGAHVFLTARRADPLERTAAALRDAAQDPERKIDHAVADVTDPVQVNEAVARCEERLGPIDLLVTSAGISRPGYVEETPVGEFRAQMETNFLGTVHAVQAVLPRMIPRREGWIATVSSMAGIKGVFGCAAYTASKFAIVGYSEVLRSELLRHGIGVTVVCPPDTRTPMLEGEASTRPHETAYLAAKGTIYEPEQVARAALRGVARRKFLVVIGFESRFLRCVNGIAPGVMDWMLDRMVRTARREREQKGR